jgi:glucose-1-phosphatase
MNIRNIIFDLGGVLLNIDYEASISAFKKLGITQFEEFFTQSAQMHLFDHLDTGTISPDEFRKGIRQISGIHISDEDIDKAWNAMLLDFPHSRIPLLKQVQGNYRTFLLSNTNVIHYPAYTRHLHETHGYESLAELFEQHYLSHEIGMRKPNVEIFEYVVRQNNLEPQQTLFFDDTKMHVEGAKKAGLHAYWIDLSREDINSFFEDGQLTKDFLTKLQNQYEQSAQ